MDNELLGNTEQVYASAPVEGFGEPALTIEQLKESMNQFRLLFEHDP